MLTVNDVHDEMVIEPWPRIYECAENIKAQNPNIFHRPCRFLNLHSLRKWIAFKWNLRLLDFWSNTQIDHATSCFCFRQARDWFHRRVTRDQSKLFHCISKRLCLAHFSIDDLGMFVLHLLFGFPLILLFPSTWVGWDIAGYIFPLILLFLSTWAGSDIAGYIFPLILLFPSTGDGWEITGHQLLGIWDIKRCNGKLKM